MGVAVAMLLKFILRSVKCYNVSIFSLKIFIYCDLLFPYILYCNCVSNERILWKFNRQNDMDNVIDLHFKSYEKKNDATS